MIIVSTSEKQTLAVASRFAAQLRGGDVVALIGNLGSGKTVFVRGVARALGVRGPMRSPTFTLMNPHRLKRAMPQNKRSLVKWLVHVDAYRIKNARELRAIGIEEYLGRPDTLVLIEWADRVRPLWKRRPHWKVVFRHGWREHERIIRIGGIDISRSS